MTDLFDQHISCRSKKRVEERKGTELPGKVRLPNGKADPSVGSANSSAHSSTSLRLHPSLRRYPTPGTIEQAFGFPWSTLVGCIAVSLLVQADLGSIARLELFKRVFPTIVYSPTPATAQAPAVIRSHENQTYISSVLLPPQTVFATFRVIQYSQHRHSAFHIGQTTNPKDLQFRFGVSCQVDFFFYFFTNSKSQSVTSTKHCSDDQAFLAFKSGPIDVTPWFACPLGTGGTV